MPDVDLGGLQITTEADEQQIADAYEAAGKAAAEAMRAVMEAVVAQMTGTVHRATAVVQQASMGTPATAADDGPPVVPVSATPSIALNMAATQAQAAAAQAQSTAAQAASAAQTAAGVAQSTAAQASTAAAQATAANAGMAARRAAGPGKQQASPLERELAGTIESAVTRSMRAVGLGRFSGLVTAIAGQHRHVATVAAQTAAGGAGNAAGTAAAAAAGGAGRAGGMMASIAAAAMNPVVLAVVAVVLLIAASLYLLHKAITATVNAVRTRIDELANIDPTVAMAKAQSEINQLVRDIKSAQRVGPALASFNAMIDKVKDKWQEWKDLFLVMAIQYARPFIAALGFAMDLLSSVPDTIAGFMQALNSATQWLMGWAKSATDAIGFTGGSNTIQSIIDFLKAGQNELARLRQDMAGVRADQQVTELNRRMTGDVDTLTRNAAHPWRFNPQAFGLPASSPAIP